MIIIKKNISTFARVNLLTMFYFLIFESMNTKNFVLGVVAIITTTVAVSNYFHQKRDAKLSDLALANIEALAQDESSGNFKKGYEASSYQWYSSLLNKWTTIPCCKYNGNEFSGCSAEDMCP